MATADAIQKPTLRKRPLGCLKTKGLKVLAGEPFALYED
jgi:hypothetical protein